MNTTNTEILLNLENHVNDIFLEYQNKEKIDCGDCPPDLTVKINYLQEQLANMIHKALSYDENSIRVNSPAGIRFKSSVSKLTREEATLTEYGFIVTRKAILDAKGVNGADFTMENEAMKDADEKGVSYGMENGKKVDRIFESDSVNTFFTAAVYNIPADKYDDVIVVRPFVKIGEEIIYGEPMAASILEVANRIASSEDYENFKETVDKILNGEEI